MTSPHCAPTPPQGHPQNDADPHPVLRTPVPPSPPCPPAQVPSSSVAEYHVAGSQSKQPGRYVVRSAFGGANGSFVVHGSEDCQVDGEGRGLGGLGRLDGGGEGSRGGARQGVGIRVQG